MQYTYILDRESHFISQETDEAEWNRIYFSNKWPRISSLNLFQVYWQTEQRWGKIICHYHFAVSS